MTLADATSQVTAAVSALAPAIAESKSLLIALAKIRRAPCPGLEYENLRLELTWDIHDSTGNRAVLGRRQRIQFLAPDVGAVRDLVWGDGEQVSRYRTRGARRVFARREGSRLALLLGIDHRPMKGECATITSRRLIEGGFLASSEYCEAIVERPTRYLGLTVHFPRTRPPCAAHLVSSEPGEPQRKLPVRYDDHGRPFLRWSCRGPTQERLYSLRWSW
jgi:hypothetical protein